jgi:hypothetical protein
MVNALVLRLPINNVIILVSMKQVCAALILKHNDAVRIIAQDALDATTPFLELDNGTRGRNWFFN